MLNNSKNLLKPKNPIEIQKRPTQQTAMAENAGEGFEAKLSLEAPLRDYKKLIDEKVQVDDFVSDELLEENYKIIAKAARHTIWKLLFEEPPQPPTEAALRKSFELLSQHKRDACFYSPWEYNDWIVELRDELIKREMLDFWREKIVKHELGPCWARDSDYFDNIDDPAPAEFYKRAGCEAPFAKSTEDKASVEEETRSADSSDEPSPPPAPKKASNPPPVTISFDTPVEDYTAKLQQQLDVDPDDEDSLAEIFYSVRKVVWDLLFKDEMLSPVCYEKAAALLDTYKKDACVYSPHDYNQWIPKVRDELFARKYFDFWKKVVVEKECGLCWYKDSEYFDDDEDTRPIEFYKSGDALMAQSASSSKAAK